MLGAELTVKLFGLRIDFGKFELFDTPIFNNPCLPAGRDYWILARLKLGIYQGAMN